MVIKIMLMMTVATIMNWNKDNVIDNGNQTAIVIKKY